MTETTVEPPVVAEPATTVEPIQLPDDHPLVKTLAAQKAELKEARAAKVKLTEIEEAAKSETQKLQDRAETAERELTATRLEVLRNSVALDNHLTPSQAKRLVGSTREELEADAKELLADLKTTPAAATADGQGKTGVVVGDGQKRTLNDVFRGIAKTEN